MRATSAVCARAAQHARELETERKDLLGVAIGDTAEFDGHEPPALAHHGLEIEQVGVVEMAHEGLGGEGCSNLG